MSALERLMSSVFDACNVPIYFSGSCLEKYLVGRSLDETTLKIRLGTIKNLSEQVDKICDVLELQDVQSQRIVHNGNEEVLRRRRLDTALRFTGAPAGDSTPLPQLTTVVWDSVGSLSSNGGAAYLADINNNQFRVRVNDFTGSIRLEMWLGGGEWSARRQKWTWRF